MLGSISRNCLSIKPLYKTTRRAIYISSPPNHIYNYEAPQYRHSRLHAYVNLHLAFILSISKLMISSASTWANCYCITAGVRDIQDTRLCCDRSGGVIAGNPPFVSYIVSACN
ncbi:hypothetical protein IG631_23369 [Alternaria alternata]|nr:hypothetical protein IG631_23369 [Alternaria alternata]